MFINYRKQAKCKMVIFGVLCIAGLILLAAGIRLMGEIHPSNIGFWFAGSAASVGVLTVCWTILGFLFALIDYKELS